MNDNTDTRRPVRRARMHEQVIRVLLKKIFRGEIAVGDKLPTERALAREFQVNRATVREALRYIENLGLIAIRQGDGAYVRNYLESSNLEIAKAMVQVDDAMRLEILSALMEIRRINLPEVAHAAALKRSATHLRRLEKAAHHSPDLPVMERDKQIHHIIGLASGNILHVLMINFFEAFFYYFGNLYFGNAKHRRHSEKFHRDIYDAIAKQDAGQAREIMHAVLRYAEQALFAEIEKSRQAPPTRGA